MSQSSRPTRMFWAAMAVAMFTAVVDLPTPPLPEATAMTLRTPGRSGLGCCAGAWA